MNGNNSSNRRRGRRRRKQKKVDLAKSPDFWGAEDAEILLDHSVFAGRDPTAMVRSLGPAPLGTQQSVSEAYFQAVYLRAAALAGALATAGGLVTGDDST